MIYSEFAGHFCCYEGQYNVPRGRCATKELRFHLVNASVVIKDLTVKARTSQDCSRRRFLPIRRRVPDAKLGEFAVGNPTAN